MKCNHPGSARAWIDVHAPVQVCCACADYVSWGEANDSDPNVLIEKRAAEIAEIATGDRAMTGPEFVGWCAHYLDDPNLDDPDHLVGYLARCIVAHEEG